MPDHPEVVRLRAQLANQRAHIVELVSMQQRREETLTSMLRELTEVSTTSLAADAVAARLSPLLTYPVIPVQVVRSEIERADNAQAELERLRQSFHAAVAVSQREPKGIPNGGTLEAQRSQAHAPAASVPIPTSSVLAEPSAPPGASQLTRHTRYARALLERAAQQKARAANAENIAVAKQHFEAAKQASASSDHELACKPVNANGPPNKCCSIRIDLGEHHHKYLLCHCVSACLTLK